MRHTSSGVLRTRVLASIEICEAAVVDIREQPMFVRQRYVWVAEMVGLEREARRHGTWRRFLPAGSPETLSTKNH